METIFSLTSLIFCCVIGSFFGPIALLIALACCIGIQQRLKSIESKRALEDAVEKKFYKMMYESRKQNKD